MKQADRARRRLGQIASFMRLGCRWTDKVKLGILGFARIRPFCGPGRVRRWLGHLIPDLCFRVLPSGSWIALSPARPDHMIVFQEIFVDRVYDFPALPFQPEVIIDCGAHSGLFTVQAAARFPRARLLAFEPDTENARFLRRQVALNRCDVAVEEAAVSHRDGEAVFCGAGLGGRLGAAADPAAAARHVRVRDLRSVVRDAGNHPLLLKMDIEGEELTLLPSVLPVLPPECAVWFEYHHGEEDWLGLRRMLEAVGFVVSVEREGGDSGTGFHYLDVAAVRSEKALDGGKRGCS